MPSSLIALPVAIPIFAAALLAGLQAVTRWKPAANVIATSAALANAIICARLVMLSRADTLVYWLGDWHPRNGIALGVCFTVDPIGAALAMLASVLALAALVFSLRYFETVGMLYHVLMLLLLAAMCGFSLSGDAFNMFVFFELMSASAFALCGYKVEERESLQGALNFAVTNTIGAFLTLAGIAFLYARTGALNLAQIGLTLGPNPDGLVAIAFVFVASGFMIKAAILPFHLWLADAHAVAPTPVCVLFSGIMVELGLYGVARMYWTIFAGSFAPLAIRMKGVMLTLGVLTAIIGAVMCFAQTHLKRLLAFSTISHMGLLLIGFALLTSDGMGAASVYLVGHSLAKAALFLATGILLHRFQTVNELELKGRCGFLLATGAVFIAGGLALAGLPPFATFFGAAALDDAAKAAGYSWLSVLPAIVGIGTGGAVLRSAGGMFLNLGAGRPRDHAQHDNVEPRSPISGFMTFPAIALMIMAALIGTFGTFRTAAATYSVRFVDAQAYAHRVLVGIPMPHPAGMFPEISEAAILHSILITLGAIAVAGYSLRRRSRRSRRIFQAPVNALRAVHTGVVGDYVIWIVVGVVVMGAALLQY